MRKLLFVLPVIACLLALWSGAGFANGTTSGTAISNFATTTAGNAPGIVNSNSTGTTVGPIYGVATDTEPANGSAGVGGSADYPYRIQNPGNVSQIISINVGALILNGTSGTAAQWGVQVDDASPFVAGLNWATSTVATAAAAGDTATQAALAPDAFATYTLRMIVANDAADGATGHFQVFLSVPQATATRYTGNNATGYAGPGNLYRNVATGFASGTTHLYTTVQGPVLSLTKLASVDSTGMAGYAGGASDPVPGAYINYEVQFSNTGTAAATTVELHDPFNVNVTYSAGSMLSCFTGGVGCVLVVDPDANAGGNDCWLDAGRISCDIATLNAADGGRFAYKVTIN